MVLVETVQTRDKGYHTYTQLYVQKYMMGAKVVFHWYMGDKKPDLASEYPCLDTWFF